MRKLAIVVMAVLALTVVTGPAMANPNGSIVPMQPGVNTYGGTVTPW